VKYKHVNRILRMIFVVFAAWVADSAVRHDRWLEVTFFDCHRSTANGESASLMYGLIIIISQISCVFLKLSILYVNAFVTPLTSIVKDIISLYSPCGKWLPQE
jgi:hypothetical protein